MSFVHHLEIVQVDLRLALYLSLLLGYCIKCMYNFCVSIPKKEEEERKKKEKRDREANTVWKSGNRLFKEIGDRLAEAEKKGCF